MLCSDFLAGCSAANRNNHILTPLKHGRSKTYGSGTHIHKFDGHDAVGNLRNEMLSFGCQIIPLQLKPKGSRSSAKVVTV